MILSFYVICLGVSLNVARRFLKQEQGEARREVARAKMGTGGNAKVEGKWTSESFAMLDEESGEE